MKGKSGEGCSRNDLNMRKSLTFSEDVFLKPVSLAVEHFCLFSLSRAKGLPFNDLCRSRTCLHIPLNPDY